MPRSKTGALREYKRLTKNDLKAFDQPSRELVLDMIGAGWIGRVSQRGHAIMRAPESELTCSVGPDHESNPNKLKMARRTFERWGRRDDPDAPPAVDENTPVEEFICTDCAQSFTTNNALGSHRKTHRPWVTCPLCHTPTKSMGQHNRYHHPHLRDEDMLHHAPEPQPYVPVSAVEEPPAPVEPPVEDSPAEPVAEPVSASLPEPVVAVTKPIDAMENLLLVLAELEALRAENAALRAALKEEQ